MTHGPHAEDLSGTLGITVAEAEDRIAATLAAMEWANLTRPMLDQLAASPNAWSTLRSVAVTRLKTQGRGQGATWAASTDHGSIDVRINPKGTIRCEMRMRTAPSTYGPDALRGRDIDISGGQLPETILVGIKGRRLDEILQSSRHTAVVPGETPIRSARSFVWGVRFTLDTPFIQPAEADIEAIRASYDPNRPLFW